MTAFPKGLQRTITPWRNLSQEGIFFVIWVGQLVSLIGSELTTFALGIWVFQTTGSITAFALIALFATLPSLLIAPVAGALVDRFDKRKMMLISDTIAGLSTLCIAILFFSGRLEIWHIYVSAALNATTKVFQTPAYQSAITMLIPAKQLGRANGMVQGAQAVAQLLAPVLAGFLVVTIQVGGVILIDFITFFCAMLTLLIVALPSTAAKRSPLSSFRELLEEAAAGWSFITAHVGLLGIFIALAISNFTTSLAAVLVTPLVLAFAPASTLGVVLSIAGSGMLFGSLFMSVWGGPRRLINGVLGFGLISGFSFMVAGLQPSAALIAAAGFVIFFDVAVVNSCNQAIWQRKVPQALQGRVFALLQMVSSALAPLAFLVAGPLVDRWFEPLLAVNGPLAGSIGQVVGIGAGRGIGLLFIVIGIVNTVIILIGYLHPRIRNVEAEMPDQSEESVSRLAG
ncbi:MAG: MFS transporter [Chloroflexota bacterium]